jgi:hypothetical protein
MRDFDQWNLFLVRELPMMQPLFSSLSIGRLVAMPTTANGPISCP